MCVYVVQTSFHHQQEPATEEMYFQNGIAPVVVIYTSLDVIVIYTNCALAVVGDIFRCLCVD